jgi:hypothetical protein
MRALALKKASEMGAYVRLALLVAALGAGFVCPSATSSTDAPPWSEPETVAAEGYGGRVAVGPDGTAHVVWEGPTAGGEFSNRDVYYSGKARGESWSPPVRVSDSAGEWGAVQNLEIGVSGDNVVHVAWYQQELYEVLYAFRSPGDEWSAPQNVSDDGTGPPLALDAADDGSVHLVYGNGDVYYVTRPSGGSWSTPVNVSNSADSTNVEDIAVDQDGSIYVMFSNQSESKSYYVRRAAWGSWSSPEVIPGIRGGSIAAYAGGVVHVVGSHYDSAIWHTSKDPGGAWSGLTNISHNSGAAYSPDIAVGPDGWLHVSWHDSTPAGILGYQILYSESASGVEWSTPLNVSNSGDNLYGASIGAGRDGSLHLVWSGRHSVYYATRPAAAVGGIAEYPQLEPQAASSSHGSSAPGTLALAGLAAVGALLLAAGGWHARRRRLT